jgi:hypothetical protein
MLINVTVGHTIKRCTQAASEDNNDTEDNAAGDDWNTPAPVNNDNTENTDGDAGAGGWSGGGGDGW